MITNVIFMLKYFLRFYSVLSDVFTIQKYWKENLGNKKERNSLNFQANIFDKYGGNQKDYHVVIRLNLRLSVFCFFQRIFKNTNFRDQKMY